MQSFAAYLNARFRPTCTKFHDKHGRFRVVGAVRELTWHATNRILERFASTPEFLRFYLGESDLLYRNSKKTLVAMAEDAIWLRITDDVFPSQKNVKTPLIGSRTLIRAEVLELRHSSQAPCHLLMTNINFRQRNFERHEQLCWCAGV